ncbi:MAG: tRNA (adenosine(37)-N6)-threonylcarbamoyltransferase complex transferase subunit TsaD [Verrucomicrobia bacterium]|nr:tRNA (adenosine(37)-N6)-threonylcarbamoyltransferase complex transferase subunit TsaD [Verrucomicrobiota bacterium]
MLGIETSCDETAAAVVRDGIEVKSSAVYSQIARHRPYGGVVPEIASRSHVELLPSIIEDALEQAGVRWPDIDRIAVTYGPGLSSSLLIGLSAAKALAMRLGVPLTGVNHLEAHLFSVFLGGNAPRPGEVCPMVVLLVSGGHTCLVRLEASLESTLLGQTLDDAAGEALDKGANLLGLGYPGGPAIEKAAEGGDPHAIDFPRGLRQSRNESTGGLDRARCFSYSGLKTALLYYLRNNPDAVTEDTLRDIAASYQEAVIESLMRPVENALEGEKVKALACVGGVARNRRLRARLDELAVRAGVRLLLAEPEFCTDNAAMIAAAAGMGAGVEVPPEGDLDVCPNLGLAGAV